MSDNDMRISYPWGMSPIGETETRRDATLPAVAHWHPLSSQRRLQAFDMIGKSADGLEEEGIATSIEAITIIPFTLTWQDSSGAVQLGTAVKGLVACNRQGQRTVLYRLSDGRVVRQVGGRHVDTGFRVFFRGETVQVGCASGRLAVVVGAAQAFDTYMIRFADSTQTSIAGDLTATHIHDGDRAYPQPAAAHDELHRMVEHHHARFARSHLLAPGSQTRAVVVDGFYEVVWRHQLAHGAVMPSAQDGSVAEAAPEAAPEAGGMASANGTTAVP